jgi:phosphatidylinositol-3-phosphatase
MRRVERKGRGPVPAPMLRLVAAVALLACAACSGTSAPRTSQVPQSQAPTVQVTVGPAASSASAVDSSASPHGQVTKLLVLVVENHSLAQMRDQMPYTAGLAKRYGYATDYRGIRHPSLPNYIAITGGDTYGIADDAAPSRHPVDGQSVFGEALGAGKTAALYADGMQGSCATEDGGDRYAVKHNPWAYYVRERAACTAGDQPMRALAPAVRQGRLPNAGMVVPNLCHDAHDCSLSGADAWIRSELELVLAGPDWRSGHLAVVITADEDDHHAHNNVLTVVVHPSQQGNVVSSPLNHYSLSGLYSDVVGAPPLKNAADAPSMAEAFGLPLS